ncbi:hypothetical protein HPB47_022113 [Ixodes persulcatus]|uniref:Uncharacterized protein n=1 Tax=Ixodes persulcatus TaxID=34615 RepID=A0AC60QAK9_IXOPE|nr:hypothetical protein HPB47_022113 [Ixodes persulcatus]
MALLEKSQGEETENWLSQERSILSIFACCSGTMTTTCRRSVLHGINGGRCTGLLVILLVLRTLRLTGAGGGGGGCGPLLRHARLWRAAQAVTMLAERPGLAKAWLQAAPTVNYQDPRTTTTSSFFVHVVTSTNASCTKMPVRPEVPHWVSYHGAPYCCVLFKHKTGVRNICWKIRHRADDLPGARNAFKNTLPYAAAKHNVRWPLPARVQPRRPPVAGPWNANHYPPCSEADPGPGLSPDPGRGPDPGANCAGPLKKSRADDPRPQNRRCGVPSPIGESSGGNVGGLVARKGGVLRDPDVYRMGRREFGEKA